MDEANTIIIIILYKLNFVGSPKERLRDEIIRNLDLTVGPEIGNPRWAPIYIYIHLRILQLALVWDLFLYGNSIISKPLTLPF